MVVENNSSVDFLTTATLEGPFLLRSSSYGGQVGLSIFLRKNRGFNSPKILNLHPIIPPPVRPDPFGQGQSFHILYGVPEGFVINCEVGSAIPKSGLSFLSHLIFCARGERVAPPPSSGLLLAW
jgi:hypothetical protein